MLNKAGSQTAEDDGVRDVLYIAMAGTHQIWVLYLKDSTWLKGGLVKHAVIAVSACIILTYMTCTFAKQALPYTEKISWSHEQIEFIIIKGSMNLSMDQRESKNGD